MDIEESKKIYLKANKILKSLEYVNYLNSWDIQTEAPVDSIEEKNNAMEFFVDYEYGLRTSEEYTKAVDMLYAGRDKLDEVLRHEIVNIKEENEKINKIPKEEYINYNAVINRAYNQFVEAKNTGNYNLVKDSLKKIIQFKKNYIKWVGGNGYDTLLDEYEKNSSTIFYDKFFDSVKKNLVPLIQKINKKELKFNREIFNRNFDVNKQKTFSEYLRDTLCLDKNKVVIKQSEHPFTTNFTNKDVRVTNHYFSDNLKSAIFSDIHEMGHALYELQVDDSLNSTMSGSGASMAMHESQSRFMENLIGRDYDFWKVHINKLKSMYAELTDLSLDDFYKYINESKCDFIRTEADELTYPIHVLIRYEIEKGIFEGKYNVDELPDVWNKFYKEYLGVEVKNNSEGILQDMHWYTGDFGYFPTYALGSAYSCQIYNAMNKDFSIKDALKNGDMRKIAMWLKDKIHKYGSSKDPDEILFIATGEKFNPDYYINYLVNKFKKLYNID